MNWPPDPSAPLNGGAFTEGKNMRNDTLNALILRHGDRMLKDTGWPPCVDMMQIAPETMPGWSVATGSLDAAHILALVTHPLRQPERLYEGLLDIRLVLDLAGNVAHHPA